MKTDTLTIENVDLEALEAQRLQLAQIPRAALPQEQQDALEAIQNMLDSWSDIREEAESYEQGGQKYKLIDAVVFGRCIGCAFWDGNISCKHAGGWGGQNMRQCDEDKIYTEATN